VGGCNAAAAPHSTDCTCFQRRLLGHVQMNTTLWDALHWEAGKWGARSGAPPHASVRARSLSSPPGYQAGGPEIVLASAWVAWRVLFLHPPPRHTPALHEALLCFAGARLAGSLLAEACNSSAGHRWRAQRARHRGTPSICHPRRRAALKRTVAPAAAPRRWVNESWRWRTTARHHAHYTQ
jgi:hypothetical protein